MSLLRRVVDSINRCYTSVLVSGGRVFYRITYRKLLKRHPAGKTDGEGEYVAKWRPLSRKPDLHCYRLFAQYTGCDGRHVPEDVSATIIQPLLNPVEFRAYYQDKNMFDKILPPSFFPDTIFRMINGMYLTADYLPIENLTDAKLDQLTKDIDTLFIKPTVDSSSGKDVLKFSRNETGKFECNDTGESFNIDFLKKYSNLSNNFIVQKALIQSEYLSQFNPTSINTLRVATYRSVKDNRTRVCAAILRIGKRGSSVDNAHAGGLFIGVSLDGTLGKFACDQYGNRYESFNGIDFKNGHYRIPGFDKVIAFAEKAGDAILHHRLIAQDICVQANGEPCLVEFNIRAFSMWLFQFTCGPAFGEYTDEIIEYCAEHRKEVKKVIVEPF